MNQGDVFEHRETGMQLQITSSEPCEYRVIDRGIHIFDSGKPDETIRRAHWPEMVFADYVLCPA